MTWDPPAAWDAPSGLGVAGYKIYYKAGIAGAPYDGSGADQGPSGISILLEDLDDIIKDLEVQMEQAAKELAFERASELRDQIKALKKMIVFEL